MKFIRFFPPLCIRLHWRMKWKAPGCNSTIAELIRGVQSKYARQWMLKKSGKGAKLDKLSFSVMRLSLPWLQPALQNNRRPSASSHTVPAHTNTQTQTHEHRLCSGLFNSPTVRKIIDLRHQTAPTHVTGVVPRVNWRQFSSCYNFKNKVSFKCMYMCEPF